ncbi:MAG: hypothetical protein AAGA96_09580 [Verrucomicrobiota bacterium]
MKLISEESAGTARWQRRYKLASDRWFYAQTAGGPLPKSQPDSDRSWIVWVPTDSSPYDHDFMANLQSLDETQRLGEWIRFRPDEESYLEISEQHLEAFGELVERTSNGT